MISSYRPKTIYVSAQTYSLLRTMADWQELDCPDTLAESILAEWLDKHPKVKRFAAEQKKRMDALRAEAMDWPDKEQP